MIVGMFTEEIAHPVYLIYLLIGRSKSFQMVVVGIIHDDYLVEAIEVGWLKGSCDAMYFIASFFSCFTHAWIGLLTCMPIGDTCRVKMYGEVMV